MSEFTAATRVVRRTGESDAAEFTAELDPRWSARDVLQGGYLLAVLGRAGADVVGSEQPHLTSASAIFLHAPRAGPANVRIEVLRTGRTATHLRGQLHQDDQLMLEAHLIQGRLGDTDSWWSGHGSIEPPDLDDCVPIPAQPPGVDFRVQMMDVVDERLDPAVLGFAIGRPAGQGIVAGYLRFKDGTDWDPLSLQVALDMGPPAHFDLGMGGGAPTVQFTSHVRRLPAPGPIWFELRATDVGGDRMTEQMRVWDSKHRLVGESSQLAAVRIPDGPPPGSG
jgi:acyl-coenzyme A thioesterase PaaI-like protein